MSLPAKVPGKIGQPSCLETEGRIIPQFEAGHRLASEVDFASGGSSVSSFPQRMMRTLVGGLGGPSRPPASRTPIRRSHRCCPGRSGSRRRSTSPSRRGRRHTGNTMAPPDPRSVSAFDCETVLNVANLRWFQAGPTGVGRPGRRPRTDNPRRRGHSSRHAGSCRQAPYTGR